MDAPFLIERCNNQIEVTAFGHVRHAERMAQFTRLANLHQPAHVSIVEHTIEGDPIYITLDAHSKGIHYTLDASQDKYSGREKLFADECASVQKLFTLDGQKYELNGCTKYGNITVLTLD
jgi:Domain of unknown function (DUF4362)